jgi:hypothetical protein
MLGKVRFLSVLVVLLGFAVHAQEGPPTGYGLLTIKVKPGTAPQFEQFMAKYREAANRTNLKATWLANSSLFGEQGVYRFARPFTRVSELAEQSTPIVDAFGPEEAAKIFQLAASSVESSYNEPLFSRTDLSRAPPPGAQAVAVLILTINVKVGANDAYEDYVRKIIEASNKTDQGRWLAFSGGPGSQSDYTVIIPYTSWEAVETQVMPIPERLRETFGKREGTRIYEAGTATIETLNTEMVRARPDLSRIPM